MWIILIIADTYFHQLIRTVLELWPAEIAEWALASLVEDSWLDCFLVGCCLGFGFSDYCNCVYFGSCLHDNHHYCHCNHCFGSRYYDYCNNYHYYRPVGHGCSYKSYKSNRKNNALIICIDNPIHTKWDCVLNDLPSTTCRWYTKCFTVKFTFKAPISTIFTLSICCCFAWDIVKEWLRLVISNSDIVFLLFLFTSTGLVARIVLLLSLTVNLFTQSRKKAF